jgi:hypothetical protein
MLKSHKISISLCQNKISKCIFMLKSHKIGISLCEDKIS